MSKRACAVANATWIKGKRQKSKIAEERELTKQFPELVSTRRYI
jgi:hypothetical protein